MQSTALDEELNMTEEECVDTDDVSQEAEERRLTGRRRAAAGYVLI